MFWNKKKTEKANSPLIMGMLLLRQAHSFDVALFKAELYKLEDKIVDEFAGDAESMYSHS